MAAKGNRRGKHRPGKVRVQLVLERRTKAILVYTAALLDMTLTDLLISGGLGTARAQGVIGEDGKVTPAHSEGVQFVEEFLQSQEGDK